MPKTQTQVQSYKRLRFLVAIGGVGLVLLFSSHYSGSALGQVSDSTLNQIARDAASNREASISSQSKRADGIDFFSLIVKGGIFMIPIGLTSVMVVTFLFDRLIGLRSGRMLQQTPS